MENTDKNLKKIKRQKTNIIQYAYRDKKAYASIKYMLS